jgi:glyoxylase-like metal-dependent hydrolase (beta-lactamase superfamily II)
LDIDKPLPPAARGALFEKTAPLDPPQKLLIMVKAREYDLINEQVIVIYDKLFPLYIVKGEKNFLIDSGVTVKAEEFYAKINRVLAATGAREEEGIQSLLLTHTHFDHIGAASYLQGKYDFDVTCSRRGAQLLQRNKVVEILNRLNQEHKKMVKVSSDTSFEKLENFNVVGDGDQIRVDEQSYFEVIETPGHTKCSIAFLLHPWQILFPGDAVGLMNPDGAIKPLFFSNYAEYVHSLEKLVLLEAEVLAFSHNKFIKGKKKVKKHLEIQLDRTFKIKDEITRYLKKEEDVTKIAQSIYEQEFPGTNLLGSKEGLLTSLESMIKVVRKECL